MKRTRENLFVTKTLLSPTNFSIDLNGEDSGEYIIEVISDGTSLEGTFSL